MKTNNNNKSERNNQVINDFGQKIGGAHKDRAREAADRLRLVDPSGLIAKPLAQVAKLPDLRALYLAGAITQEAARRAWWLWSQIGPKPAVSRPWRVRDWAQAAAGIIQAVADILAYGDCEKSQLPDGAREYQPADLFDEEMNAANWPAEDYKRGAYFVGRHWMGCGFSIHSHKSSYNQGFESVAACVDAIREKVGSNADRTPVAADFDIYKTRATGVYFVAPKSKPGIKLMQFDDFDAAYNYRREHPEALAERLAELRNLPAERHDWNRPRVGADYRNGKDLTPEAFADAFPFRGVEFGNWVTQLERAANLNECADALRDMAAVIGIKPEAVALGGSLAWAFGSRGVGRALAHYETGRRVINLTKKKGNGCVAHEWFHALDNYLMIQAGKPSLFMVADSCAYGNGEKSQLYTAAADLRCALQRSEMYTRSKRIDELKSKPYWATTTEMAARAFEAYILYKLEAAGICNDYLVSITPENDYSRSECYPYPTREEAAQLAPLFDAFLLAAFSEADRVSEPAAEQAAEGAAYGDGEKSQNAEAIRARIAEIRAAILEEYVSYEEIAYLSEHAQYIDPADTLLLEWANVPEHAEDEAPAVAASEPMNDDPTPDSPNNGEQGAPYGEAEKSQISEDVAVSVPDVKEYKLMYLFGAWVGHSRVYAETDAEAIHDATDNYITSTLPRWAYRVELWEGSRLVHVFKEDGPDDIGRRDMEQEESENAPAYIVRDTTEGPFRFDDCATGSILAAVDRVAKNEHTANPHPLQLFADGVKVWDREEHPTEYLAHIVRQRLAL